MADFIKRQQTNLGRQSRLDVSGGQRFNAAQSERGQDMLFALAGALHKEYALKQDNAKDNYLQVRAIKLKSDLAPKLETLQSQEDIDSAIKEFDAWDEAKRKELLGSNADKFWAQKGAPLSEQTKALETAAKLKLTKQQAATEMAGLVENTARNFALSKNPQTQKEIDEGFLVALEKKNLDGEDKNKIIEQYRKAKDKALNETAYLKALSIAQKNPQNIIKTILDPQQWQDLNAQQREHLLGAAKSIAKDQKGTLADPSLNTLNQTFAVIMQQNPAAARQFLQELSANPGTRETKQDLSEIMGKENAEILKQKLQDLSQNDYDTVLAAWKSIAQSPDGIIGMQQISTAENITNLANGIEAKENGNTFVVTDKLTGTELSAKDTAKILSQMNEEYKNIVSNDLKKIALNQMEKTKILLGNMVKRDSAQVQNASFLRSFWPGGYSGGDKMFTSADEYIKYTITANYPNIAPAQAGELYYRLLINAQAQGIDLEDNSATVKQKSFNLLNEIVKQEAQVNYYAPQEAQAVIAQGQVIAPFTPKEDYDTWAAQQSIQRNYMTLEEYQRVMREKQEIKKQGADDDSKTMKNYSTVKEYENRKSNLLPYDLYYGSKDAIRRFKDTPTKQIPLFTKSFYKELWENSIFVEKDDNEQAVYGYDERRY